MLLLMTKIAVVYLVVGSSGADVDLGSGHLRVVEVADGDRRFVRIAGVDSQRVVSLSKRHGAVARHAVFETPLRPNVHLNAQYHASSAASFIPSASGLLLVHW